MGSIYRAILFVALASQLHGQLPPATAAKIDAAAEKTLADTGAPSASIAVVKDGKIAYVKAYGNARPEMRYSIGSVSKQITAAAILLLVQDGKLTLDDPVARFLPSLTRAKEITIRQLLSHTSGYRDYYPLDYVASFMLRPVTADEILKEWAGKPLDFDPGTRWQYSNTNYVVAGRIIEQITGKPLMAFLESRIFRPLGMESVLDRATRRMPAADAAGYTRFALGPPRPVPPEGRGWLFAAGELAMTARDLALWDISLIEHKLLTPASMDSMTTPVRLKNGAPTGYALGVGVSNDGGHLKMQHGGAVSGFVSENTVWPEERAAIVVFANLDGSGAPGLITEQIAALEHDPQAAQQLALARRIYDDLANGKIDRTLLSSDADAYFTPQVLADAAASLKSLGTPEKFDQTSVELRGGMTYRHFRIEFKSKSLNLSTFTTADGKLAQYLIQ